MGSLYDPKAIRQEINSLLDEAKSLSKLAQAEEREPTEEEQKRFDEIIAKVGESGDEPSGLHADLARAERYQKILSQDRLPDQSSPVNVGGYHVANTNEPFKLPQSAARVRPSQLRNYSDGSSDNPIHDAYASGKWLMAILGDAGARNWCEDHGIGIQASMTEGDNSKGGFFVPSEMSSRIIDLRYQYGVFRRFADVEPMGSDVKSVPRRKSGVTAYALGEEDTYTASDMTFSQVELVAKKWGVLTKISDELDEDSMISIVDRFVGEVGWAFAKREDEAGFVGTGTIAYHGIAGLVSKANDGSHAGALYTPTAGAGTLSFADLTLAMFHSMAGQLPSWAEDGAAWYVHKVGYHASIAKLQTASGGNTVTDIGNGPEMAFLGKPVRFTPVMNSTLTDQASTAGLVILANLQQSSTLGDRRSNINLKVLNELYAATGQIGLRADERVAINNHSITDPEDATGATAGAVVVLKMPAN